MEQALHCVRFQFSGHPQKHIFGCACVLCLPQPQRFRQPGAWAHFPRMWRAFSLRGERPKQPEAWAPSPRVRRAFSLRGPSERRGSGLRESLDRNLGPVCHVGGGGFSGAEFAPFPSPLKVYFILCVYLIYSETFWTHLIFVGVSEGIFFGIFYIGRK